MVGVPGCANSAVSGVRLVSPGFLPLRIATQKLIKKWDDVIFRFQRELAFAEENDRLEAGSSCGWYCNCMAAV